MPRSWHRDRRCIFLPALTSTACRIKINVTAAVSVESHSHLFVFHLVVHFCISMISARSCTENGRLLIKSGPFHNPQKRKKKCLYYSAMCERIKMLHTARLGPSDPLPLKPSSQTDGKGLSWKKSAKHSVPRELRTVRRLDKSRNAEPEPTVRYWHWKNPRSSNHQSGKLTRDPPPALWKRSEQHLAEHHYTPVQPNYRAQRSITDSDIFDFPRSTAEHVSFRGGHSLKDNNTANWRKLIQMFHEGIRL